MPILNKGETFVDGQQVSGQRLNDLIDNATALPELITTQTPIADPVADGDGLLIHDASAAALRKLTVQELFSGGIAVSSLAVTTSVINGQTGSDIAINPNDGTVVTGSTFASVDGITVEVNSAAHGLVAGQFVSVTASNTAYSGTFLIASSTTNGFTYITLSEQTPASGTCTYTKEGAIDVNGNMLVSNNLVVGQDVGIVGTVQIGGDLNLSGEATFSDLVDFTGGLKINGNQAWYLYDVVEQDISSYTTTAIATWELAFTSSAFVKPLNEMWVFEANGFVSYPTDESVIVRFANAADTVNRSIVAFEEIGGPSPIDTQFFTKWVVDDETPLGDEETPDSIKIYIRCQAGNFNHCSIGRTNIVVSGFSLSVPNTKLRIFKYKKT
jgi:hypothetical protein